MDRTLNSRSKGLASDSHCWSCEECRANFSFNAAYPAVMDTWWMKIVSEKLKLPAYLYDVCHILPEEMRLPSGVSYTMEGYMVVKFGADIRS